MKRFLHILVAFLIVGPFAVGLYAAPMGETAPKCAITDPASCCCETEVQNVPAQPIGAYVVSTVFQPHHGVLAVPAVLPVDVDTRGHRVEAPSTSVILPTHTLYLTIQSFLI